MAKLSTRGRYRILVWTDPETGRRRRKSLGLVGVLPEKDAQACLRIKQYELSTGARLLNAHRRPAPRFADFLRDYLLWHKMEYPNSHYRVEQIAFDHLEERFGSTQLNLLTVAEVEKFKTERRFLAKASTVAKELRVLQAIINRAVDLKIISDNPVSIVQPPKLLDSKPHHYYQADELALLYAQSSYGSIWRFMANTGIRRGEALNLRRMWITDAVRIESTGEERTKSGEWRKIPYSDGARMAVASMVEDGPYLLPRIAPESLSRAFKRDAEATGLGGSLHSLRHTYICHLLLAGENIRTVQLYAGHAHISTTEKYAYQVLNQHSDKALRLAI